MISPPYTLESFIRLVELQNQRGNDLSREDREVRRATRALQKRRLAFRLAMSKYTKGDPTRDLLRAKYEEDRRALRLDRDSAVELAMHNALATFEHNLRQTTFTFDLKTGPVVLKKQTYSIASRLDVQVPARQASDVLKKSTSVTGSSRNSIIRALKEALGKQYTHAVYKIDIQSFFESIPHEILLRKVTDRPDLDRLTIDLVRRLLTEYEAFSGSAIGLPRGVGLSSQLAELYMRDFDSRFKAHPGVLFYARYVDDMVLILESERVLQAVKQSVVTELSSLSLATNSVKTHDFMAGEDGSYLPADHLEYLGYRFHRNSKALETSLTTARKNRRRTRLERALNQWLLTSPNSAMPNHGHDGLLVDRVKFLASNTRLVNSKSEVAIGLYHSNSALDPGSIEFLELDAILEGFLKDNSSKMTDQVFAKLSSISFAQMFITKPFLRFRQGRLDQITKVWIGIRS